MTIYVIKDLTIKLSGVKNIVRKVAMYKADIWSLVDFMYTSSNCTEESKEKIPFIIAEKVNYPGINLFKEAKVFYQETLKDRRRESYINESKEQIQYCG